jgi:hypothetical protein
MLDILAPLIPEILEVKKMHQVFDGNSNPYYRTKSAGRQSFVKFTPRMESLSLWRELRMTGESGLSPDEALAIYHVLSPRNGRVEVVTDYPSANSKLLQIGNRMFYSSFLEVREFLSNLSIANEKKTRNAYLPRNPIVTVERLASAAEVPSKNLSNELGEWCYISF